MSHVEPITEKTCSRCGNRKPVSSFDKNPKMGDGYLCQCKDCKRPGRIAAATDRRKRNRKERISRGEGFRGNLGSKPLEDGEEFCGIHDFPGYRISNKGRFQSCFLFGSNRMTSEWRDRPTYIEKNGYVSATLYKNRKCYRESMHVLILNAFVGPRPSGYQACHNNGIRSDNRLDNLRWDTVSANHMDKHAHGTMPIGSNHQGSKLTEEKVIEIRRMADQGLSDKIIGNKFGISSVQVYNIKTRKQWKHI